MAKSKITTIILLSMTVILMAAILVIGFIITRPAETTSLVAPRKTKAQSITYARTIAFNTITPTVTPTVMPTAIPTAIPTLIAMVSPSPTEIILAKISLSPTKAASISATILPTKTNSLPATGTVTNALIIFAAAGLMIFFSFLF